MEDEALELIRRNSGLRLDAQGRFHFQGGPVESERVQALFHRGLSVRSDGEVILTVGTQWAYVACDGVARFIERLRASAEGLFVTLRGDADGRLWRSPRVAFAPDGRCYVWDGEGGPPAVLLRAAHHAVATQIREDAHGHPVLWAAGLAIPVGSLSRVPRADEAYDAVRGSARSP